MPGWMIGMGLTLTVMMGMARLDIIQAGPMADHIQNYEKTELSNSTY